MNDLSIQTDFKLKKQNLNVIRIPIHLIDEFIRKFNSKIKNKNFLAASHKTFLENNMKSF